VNFLFPVGNRYRSRSEPFDKVPFLKAVAAFWVPSAVNLQVADKGEYFVNLEQLALCCIKLEKRIADPYKKANIGTADSTDMVCMVDNLELECHEHGNVTKPQVVGINCQLEDVLEAAGVEDI
jgi:hypothetical protein